MAAVDWDPVVWAEVQFGTCELGDRRRNKRLVNMAQQFAARPDASTPQQTETWGDLKAAYRLFDTEDVTPAAIREPHCQSTREGCQRGDIKLIICDTTELDYTKHKQVRGLGPIGNGRGRGLLAHTALMVDAKTGAADGIAAQEFLYRKASGSQKKPGKNTIRRSADRESAVWGRVIDAVGRPPEGVIWLHVCDRAADDYEVFQRAIHQGCGCVIRASRLNRKVITSEGQALPLSQVLAALPPQGERDIPVPAQGNQRARTARVTLRFGSVSLPVPVVLTPWLKTHRPTQPLKLQVVELVELDPPQGVTPIRWVLYTTEPVTNIDQANEVIMYYEMRWTIEDFHKCWKTGCHVEERQYETADRLERVAAVTAIVAVRLLQLRTAAKETPEAPAETLAPQRWVALLRVVRKIPPTKPLTIRDFVRQLAGLGGFLLRKHDGEPGWQTIWRGYETLTLMARGADAMMQKCG